MSRIIVQKLARTKWKVCVCERERERKRGRERKCWIRGGRTRVSSLCVCYVACCSRANGELIIERVFSSNYTAAALFYRGDRGIGSRQLISGSTFRCVDRHFLSVFNYRPGKWDNCTRRKGGTPASLAIFFIFFFLFLLFFVFSFNSRSRNFLYPTNIYQRLIRIPQASWRDCKQLRSFLHGPFPSDQLFAFVEINRKLQRNSRIIPTLLTELDPTTASFWFVE